MPITLIAHVPNVLVITPERAAQLKVASARDLVGLIPASHPGQLNYASGPVLGSAGHMAGELLKSQAKVSAVHIPYAGAGPAQLGLLAAESDIMFDNLASASAQIKAGKSQGPCGGHAAAREFAARGSDDGRKRLAWVRRVHLVRRLRAGRHTGAGRHAPEPDADSRTEDTGDAQRLARMGAEPAPMSSEQFAELVRNELAKYEKIVKFSGARVD